MSAACCDAKQISLQCTLWSLAFGLQFHGRQEQLHLADACTLHLPPQSYSVANYLHFGSGCICINTKPSTRDTCSHAQTHVFESCRVPVPFETRRHGRHQQNLAAPASDDDSAGTEVDQHVPAALSSGDAMDVDQPTPAGPSSSDRPAGPRRIAAPSTAVRQHAPERPGQQWQQDLAATVAAILDPVGRLNQVLHNSELKDTWKEVKDLLPLREKLVQLRAARAACKAKATSQELLCAPVILGVENSGKSFLASQVRACLSRPSVSATVTCISFVAMPQALPLRSALSAAALSS